MQRGACFISSSALALCVACSEAPQEKVERTLTSTVTLSLEDTLAVDSAVTLRISGEPRLDEIYATLNAVVTASTSSRAAMLADKLSIGVERRDRTVALVIPVLKDAVLSGELLLRVPSDMKIDVVERGDTVDVSGMNHHLRIASRSHVRIVGAQEDVVVGVVQGNVVLDVELNPGTNIDVRTDAGDIDFAVPQTLSVTLVARTMNGTIIPQHPQLPPFRGGAGEPYGVVVGGGLSNVQLQTGVGNIIIRTR